MKTREYLKALQRLDLLPHALATAAALGVTKRAVQKYAQGEVLKIPGPIERLLAMYEKHGVPKEYRR